MSWCPTTPCPSRCRSLAWRPSTSSTTSAARATATTTATSTGRIAGWRGTTAAPARVPPLVASGSPATSCASSNPTTVTLSIAEWICRTLAPAPYSSSALAKAASTVPATTSACGSPATERITRCWTRLPDQAAPAARAMTSQAMRRPILACVSMQTKVSRTTNIGLWTTCAWNGIANCSSTPKTRWPPASRSPWPGPPGPVGPTP